MAPLPPAFAGVPGDPLKEAISREVSVYVGGSDGLVAREVFSREVSFFAGADPPSRFPETFSREVSLVITTPTWPAPVSTLSASVSPTGERVTLDWSSYNEIAQADVLRYAIYMSAAPSRTSWS